MARKKTGRNAKSFSEAVGFRNKYHSDTTDFFLGLFLLALTVYVLIAMVSYLSTGQADQSTLEQMRPGEIMNSNHEFTNYCGSIGALLSYYLITQNFGIPAFLIPFFITLVALKLMKAYSVNLLKWFFGLALVMVWTSITFAKFLTPIISGQVFNTGGKHGLF